MKHPESTHQLPINSSLPALQQALCSGNRALLSAPPGSGKTTLVPLKLLDQPWLSGRRILMLEPRRLAARAAAARMAWLLGEPVGQTVGYRIRFERKVSAQTRVEVLTEGILTRRLQQDPELAGVGLIIFDEYHERSLNADLALALALDISDGLRDDLRLLVMSATLDSEAVSQLLGGAPVISGSGRSYPVETHYLKHPADRQMVASVVAGVRRALAEQRGDILVFLPGVGEIRSVERQLHDLVDREILLCPLYGDLNSAAQQQAIEPDAGGRRRVVLTTSIAETSLTIEGVDTVVDSGWSRQPRFDPNSGLTRLQTIRVSRAAADQRRGRAGRLAPGVCYRLWSRAEQSALPPHSKPEICVTDLAPLLLELALWGVTDPACLRWLDAPPPGALAQARELLQALDAVDRSGRISAAGRRMAALPLHPRLAHMLLQGEALGQGALVADLAALISERDIMRRRSARQDIPVDIEQRLPLLSLWRARHRAEVQQSGGDAGGCARVVQVSGQLQRLLQQQATGPVAERVTGLLLAAAYPDGIAQRRQGGGDRFLLRSGRAVRLPEGDLLGNEPYLVVAAVDAGRVEGRVFLAASIELAQIRETQQAHIERSQRVSWERATEAVVAVSEERLGALLLSVKPIQQPDAELLSAAMLQGIRSMGLDCLAWSPALQAWRERVASLCHWQPHAGWPDLDDQSLLAGLEQWLLPWLNGASRRRHLQRIDLKAALLSLLSWQQQQQLERLAPTHIQVPSGSRKRLEYRPGESPVLQVRLQELFGLADTPRICDGEVAVTLHLLSPAQRPVQVTQDLRGFWEHTYSEVKRELKGRYPKHHWPDDPWQAAPTARARRRVRRS